MQSFKDKVLNVVSKITKGKVLTYKEVAKKAGNEKASRVVGNLMAKNQDKNIPCHRVIKSDGTFGKYNGLQGKSKTDLLNKEKHDGKRKNKSFREN